RDQEIYVIGGANSAGQGALFFSQYARSVTMVVRGSSLTKSMSQYLIEQIEAIENIKLWMRAEVVEAHGSD
ncbi:MAG: NAD-binding protein, partial [Armatimonadetes bacterium]|nr:NAD-binding protein [Armatimonadota bacterium]